MILLAAYEKDKARKDSREQREGKEKAFREDGNSNAEARRTEREDEKLQAKEKPVRPFLR